MRTSWEPARSVAKSIPSTASGRVGERVARRNRSPPNGSPAARTNRGYRLDRDGYSSASGYFVRRRRQVGGPWEQVIYHRFPKLGVICDVQHHFIFAYRTGRGPKPDVNEFESLVTQELT